MHDNAMLVFRKFARDYFKPNLRILEVGPRIPSEFQMEVNDHDPSITWDTLDIYESEKLTYVAKDPYVFPIADQSYDIVFSSQVMEHVPAPWRWMREVSRVCRIAGYVITINPVNWGFHEFPVDCWRAYPEGLRALYLENKIDPVVMEFGAYETYRDRMNWRGLRWILKKVLRRHMHGQPFYPIDNIGIGRRIP